jgi:hypothetical protein
MIARTSMRELFIHGNARKISGPAEVQEILRLAA